jgi:hypothetical protein
MLLCKVPYFITNRTSARGAFGGTTLIQLLL